MYKIRIQQAKQSIFATNISLEMAIKTISNLFESYIMEENRIQNITKNFFVSVMFLEKAFTKSNKMDCKDGDG